MLNGARFAFKLSLIAALGFIPVGCGATAAPGVGLRLPPGFRASVVSTRVPGARFIAFAPNGDLVVSIPRQDRVVAIRHKAGANDEPAVVVSNLALAHGLAFRSGDLYIAAWAGVAKIAYPPHAGARPQMLFSDMPQGGDHNLRALALAGDGSIFVSSGSTCNVCKEQDPRFATVLSYDRNGGHERVYAKGLRNASGLAFDDRGRLWAVVNGRDWLGNDRPADELNLLADGADYGWPYCYALDAKRLPNPEYNESARCLGAVPAAFEFQAHSAPLGIAFNYKDQFPPQYRGAAFVAFHGSWNRMPRTGYKVVTVFFKNGKPVRVVDFMTGWLTSDGNVLGRPVGVAFAPDGSLFVSDDDGIIYRVSYEGKK